MIVLNITVAGVTYKRFMGGLFSFVIEFMILARDVTMITLSVTLLNVAIYFLFRLHKLLHRTLKYLLLTVNVCLFLTDLFTLYFFQLPFNSIMMEILSVSNVREGVEFADMYFYDAQFYMFILLVAALVAVLFCAFRLLRRYKIVLLAIIVLFCGLGLYVTQREYVQGRGFTRFQRTIALSRLGFMTYDMLESQRQLNEALNKPQDIHITKNDGNIPYVVFMLGEATGRSHLGIYGYELNTTPLLAERMRSENLYIFDDIVSPHGATVPVMREIFTFCGYGSVGNWFEYTSLFNILKQAGYETFWMTNQERRPGSDPRNVYSSQCINKDFTEALRTEQYHESSYDESLLVLLDKAMKQVEERNFVLLHMLGTHGHYHKRYPAKYETFTPNDEKGFGGITKIQRVLRAQYDNAVLYNDFIINDVISRFEDKNAIVIYLSDHGEEVYDSMNFVGHGGGVKSRFIIEVPLIVWCSQKFTEVYPELVQRTSASVHRPYMTDDLIHTLLDLMGIETDEYVPSKSVINPAFDASRQRIFLGCLYTKEDGLREIH